MERIFSLKDQSNP